MGRDWIAVLFGFSSLLLAAPPARAELTTSQAKSAVASQMKAYESLMSRSQLSEEIVQQASAHLTLALLAAADQEDLRRYDSTTGERVLDMGLALSGLAGSLAGGASVTFCGVVTAALIHSDCYYLGTAAGNIGLGLAYVSYTLMRVSKTLFLRSVLNIPARDRLTPKVLKRLAKISRRLEKSGNTVARDANEHLRKLAGDFVEEIRANGIEETAARCNIALAPAR